MIPVQSPAFRLACYAEFKWTPAVVRALPESEAELLAIYFEETGGYQARMARKYRDRSASPGYDTVEELD